MAYFGEIYDVLFLRIYVPVTVCINNLVGRGLKSELGVYGGRPGVDVWRSAGG